MIDVTGLACPYPQLLAQSALDRLAHNAHQVVDNPPSLRDVPEALGKRGYASEVTPFDKTKWKIVVRKKDR